MIMGYAKAALAFLEGAGILTKLAIAAGLIAAAGIAYGVWHHEIYQSGVNDAVAGIARADQKLVDRALKARAKLKECQALNRPWDQTTGKCA